MMPLRQTLQYKININMNMIRDVCKTLMPPSFWNICERKWAKKLHINWFFTSKRQNSSENCSIVPTIKPGLDIILKNLYNKFRLNMCIICNANDQKLQIIEFFSMSKGHYSVRKCLMIPNILFIMINLYIKFHLNISIFWRRWTETVGGATDRHSRQTEQQQSNMASLLQRGHN